MSDFMSNARNNAKFNKEMGFGGGQNPRAAQLNARNASSFNPIGFNPEPTAYVDDEKQRKKDKQRQYRDQLDQMVSGVPSKKSTPEIPQQQYQYQGQQQQHEFDPVREKRDLEQRYMQANLEKQQEKSYPESRVLDSNPYYAGNDYGRYPAPQNDYPNVSSGTYARRGESPVQTQNQSRRQTQRDLPNAGGNDPASTFNQQDELRDQLLAKIRSGNKQPNNYVYNTYQMAHEEKERSRKDFERNVIDKAAQDKLAKEDQRASSQWEQKKRMERETYLANQQAIQAKSQQKKRSQQQELVSDQRSIKDSLEQFQKQDYESQLRKKKLMEENSKVLQQQRYDYQTRKHGQDQDIRTSGVYGQGEPSPTKAPSDQYNAYDRYPEPTQQKAPLVSRPGADNWDQGDLASGMENLNIKGGYGGYQPSSYHQDDYTQKYAGLDQGAGAQGGYSRQQPQDDYAYEKYGRNDDDDRYKPHVVQQTPGNISSPQRPGGPTDARSDYVKIRDKVRYGNSYNIISNELR